MASFATCYIMGVVGFYDSIVSQLLPVSWRLQAKPVIDWLPGWPWQNWVLLLLAMILVVVVERAYRHSSSTNKGLFDFYVDGPKAAAKMTNLLKNDTKTIERLGRGIGKITPHLEQAGMRIERRRRLLSQVAKRVSTSADRIRRNRYKLETEWATYKASYEGLIEWHRARGQDALTESIRSLLPGLAATVSASIKSTAFFRSSIMTLRQENYSETLNVALEDLARQLEHVINLMEQVRVSAGAMG